MIKLTLNTNDDRLSKLAHEYWETGANGQWQNKVSELAARYETNPSGIVKLVRKSCNAYAVGVVCPRCHKPMEVSSRTAYETLVRSELHISRWQRRERALCEECLLERCREEHQLAVALAEAERCAIEAEIAAMVSRLTPMSYATADVKDAFLLYGLLYLSNDGWQSGHLEAWSHKKPLLFAHKDDTEQTYLQLYRHGWIAPCPSSRPDAFHVDSSGKISFIATRVNWILAPDSSGMSFDELPLLLDTVLQKASAEDAGDLWYRVCLSELRSYFEEVHERFRFSSRGWTPLVKENMTQLLRECSVAEAKGVIWSSIKSLASLLQDSHYAKQHVFNMIPNSFPRTLKRWRANGKPLTPWQRPSIEKEAIFTSLLFDKVLGGGNHAYATLNGSNLNQQGGELCTLASSQ